MTRFLFSFFTLLVAANNCFAGELPKPVIDSDFRQYPAAQVKLGQLLFYDRVLSGTYRVSCATCHNHDRASSNGFLLDGKTAQKSDELAVNRLPVYEALKPSSRHAPALFNLGAMEFQTMFIDGRVAKVDGTFVSPAGSNLPMGVNDVLAVQALFPAVAGGELVGTVDNDIKAIAHKGSASIWEALTRRVRDLPDYIPHFRQAFDDVAQPQDIRIHHIANAISAFVGTEWRADRSPFDAYLRGDRDALNDQQIRGMNLFYGSANCSACHAGPFQTDHQFHRVDFPASKNGKAEEDGSAATKPELGRYDVTRNDADKFKYRTLPLRNVARTAPYGHLGEVTTLQDVLAFHHQHVSGDKGEEIADLITFLESLTDEASLKGRLGKPADVPSSLALD